MNLISYKSKISNKNFTKTIIILEIAQSHDGSLGQAISYIELAHKLGADGVKFQLHIADEESTRDEQFRVNFSHQDNSRFDYWKRMEFTLPQWKILKAKAQSLNLLFVISVFSKKAVIFANSLKADVIKLGSGEFDSYEILEEVSKVKRPIIVSTGMSNDKEISNVIKLFKRKNLFTLMHCTSIYPTPVNKIGLNNIDELRRKYNCNIGYSDHSGNIYAPIISITKKIKVLEIHVTFHKDFFGPDVSSSLDPQEIKTLIEFNNAFYEIEKNPTSKNKLSKTLKSTRDKFSKSLSLSKDLSKDTVITREHLCLKKPGTGIKPNEMKKYIGKKLKKNVLSNRLLRKNDFY